MRLIMVAVVGAFGLAARADAEEHPTVLPEIVIGGPATAPAAVDSCVEVDIGSSRAMNCLNRKLKQEVDRVNPSQNVPPLDARSPDTKTGVVNIPGVQQQYGRNFGHSVVPYRPPPVTYAPSLGPRH